MTAMRDPRPLEVQHSWGRSISAGLMFLLSLGISTAQAAGIVSGLPQASQPLGTLPDAVLLDQGTGCPTATAPCTTSQSPSLRVGQPYQGIAPPASPFLYQLWWNTSVTPNTLNIYDGSQWVLFGNLNSATHVWNGAGPFAAGTITNAMLAGSIVASKLLLPKFGAGCTLSNDLSSPNTVIDIAPCHTADDSTNAVMQQSAVLAKVVGGAWSVGSGGGCLDTGSIAPATWYYLFQIERSDTGIVDYLCTASYASPTMPTPYAQKRYIGPFRTDAGSNILAFTQVGNEFLWAAPPQDVAGATCSTTAASATLTSVPSGYRVQANLRASIAKAVDAPILLLSSLDEADSAPGTPTGNFTIITPVLGIAAAGQTRLLTNTTRQIRQRCSVAGSTLNIVTVGWVDPQIAWPH